MNTRAPTVRTLFTLKIKISEVGMNIKIGDTIIQK